LKQKLKQEIPAEIPNAVLKTVNYNTGMVARGRFELPQLAGPTLESLDVLLADANIHALAGRFHAIKE